MSNTMTRKNSIPVLRHGPAVATSIRDRKEFRNSTRSLRGVTVPEGQTVSEAGRLSGDDLARFRVEAPDIRYVVYSYATPIAWWALGTGWYRVQGRFSTTTSSKHQPLLYLIKTGDA